MRIPASLKLPVHIWPGYFAIAVQAYGTSAVFFLALYLTTSLHISIIHAGLTLTLLGVGTFTGSAISPLFSRYLGEQRTAFITLFGMALILMVLPHVTTLTFLNILVLIYGALTYAFIPANQVWVLNQVSAEQRVHANNVWRISKNILISIGFIINGFLSHHSFELMFTIAALVLMAGCLVIFLIAPKYNTAIIPAPALAPTQIKPHRDPYIYAIYFALFLIGLIYSQLKSNYPIYLHNEYGLSVASYGLLFALNTWLVIGLQVPLLHSLRRFKPTIVTAIGGLLIGCGMLLLAFGHSMTMAVVSCITWTCGEILFFSLTEVLLINYADQKAKVLFMSLYQFIYAIGAIVGPLGGSLIYHYQTPTLLWYVCGLAGLLTFIICLALPKLEQRKSETRST